MMLITTKLIKGYLLFVFLYQGSLQSMWKLDRPNESKSSLIVLSKMYNVMDYVTNYNFCL